MPDRSRNNGQATDPLEAANAKSTFIFATGIECSYPIIDGSNRQPQRVDQMEKTFHYKHWKDDFALVRQLGLKYLRYGPPYYRTHAGPEQYDWEWTDQVFTEIRRLGIVPIADLCHFGLPDWAGDFQNPEWPELFAKFARAFAERFPWVQFYTPVNEIFVCAKMSTLTGAWNERRTNDERAFVTAVKHMCRANLLAIKEILEVRPDAIFIQSESAEYTHAGTSDPGSVERANFENQRRFIPFDLLYCYHPNTDVGIYLFDHGMTREEYQWFMGHGLGDHIVMGNDFYERNEHIMLPGGHMAPAGEVFGWSVITKQYFDRYQRPVMHTETNYRDAHVAPRWLWKQFFNVRHLRQQGVPVIGFTWYSLTDQVDWDSGLRYDRGVVNPLGLYDLQRKPRLVAEAYRMMLEHFRAEPLVPGSRSLALFEGTSEEDRKMTRYLEEHEQPPRSSEVA